MTWRVGVLETVAPALNVANFDALRAGLRDLGYIEGRNLVIEYRSADSERVNLLFPQLGECALQLFAASDVMRSDLPYLARSPIEPSADRFLGAVRSACR